jgi:plastocyanin
MVQLNHPDRHPVNIHMRPLLRGAAIALTAVALASCSSSSNDGGQPAAGSAVITIKDFGYGSPVTVAPGATVTVKQEDSVKHNVFSNDFKVGLLDKGQTATFTAPTAPGTYEYTCTVHGKMHGQLIVQAGGGSPANTDDSGPGGY